MKKTYFKHVIREVRFSLGRFFSIFGIVALGVGFLAGLLATTPDMRLSIDRYYDESAFYDVRVVGTLGLTQEDVTALREVEGVEAVMPAYSSDVLLMSGQEDNTVARVASLPFGSESDFLNQVELMEGRLPQTAGECVVVESKLHGTPAAVGDVLRFSPENEGMSETFAVQEFTVVGVVRSAYYFSIERESSQLGSGTVGMYLYTVDDSFCLDVFTDIYLSVQGAADMNTFLAEYDEVIEPVLDRLETLGVERSEVRTETVRADAEQELADARQQLADGRQELADAKAELDDAAQQLSDARKELEDSRTQLEEGKTQLEDGWAQLEEGRQTLADNRAQLEAGRQEWEENKAQFEQTIAQQEQTLADGEAELAAGRETLEDAKAQLDEAAPLVEWAEAYIQQLRQSGQDELADQIEAQYGDQIQAYHDGLAEYNAGMQALTEREAELAAGKQTLETMRQQGQAELAAAEKEIIAGEAALEEGEAELAANEATLRETQAQLEEAEQQLADGEAELAESEQDYADGKKEYDEQAAEAELEFADAEQQIADGESELASLEAASWYVFDRDDNVSYASFDSNAEKVQAIAQVFPVFFFLVAALVVLTTMTRMVEEQRTQIGTMKALGYGKGAIIVKYMIYAGIASVVGSVFGLAVGLKLFPTVIWNAYDIMYILPDLMTPVHWGYALFSSGSIVACTLVATFLALYATLHEQPARLMLPRAPKAGKRVFLERIGILWKHMSFTQKVTARNLIRYKKRFFMTVIGIAGCTALLLAGLGLRDSIGGITEKQYSELHQYDLMVGLGNGQHNDEVDAALQQAGVEDSLYAAQSTGTILSDDGEEKEITFFVPQDADKLTNFIAMRDRKSGESVPFSEDTVLLTEKMANILGLQQGDTVRVRSTDGEEAQFTIGGVVENYVYNYLYLSPALYEAGFGEAPEYNLVNVKLPDLSEETKDTVASQLLKVESVGLVQFTDDLRSTLSDTLSNIDYIVWVLIICAGLLAFVVLYNLTNINLTERQKEIATLKVLGFYDKEAAMYVYRETAILSVIGTLVGLVLGIFLHAFVVSTAEVDMVMFGRDISWMSYLLSALLTLAFSAIVCLVMVPKLKKIDMVESLKAGE